MVYIDGDLLLYHVGFASESPIYFIGEKEFPNKWVANKHADKFNHNRKEIRKEVNVLPWEITRKMMDNLIMDILSETNADDCEIVISGNKSFRKELDPTYKAHRPGLKPKWYKELKKYLLDTWFAITAEDEADDYIARKASKHDIIASLDKDFDQLEGKHYNWKTKELYYIDELMGWRNFYTQMLTGDVADNIKGVHGIGIKTAQKILKSCKTKEEMQEAVRKEYEKFFGTEEAKERYELNYKLLRLG